IATVTSSSSGTPTGSVSFYEGAVLLATSSMSGGQTTATLLNFSVGNHTLTSVYNGDANFQTSTSNAVTQTINKGSTTTTLTSSLNPSDHGQSVTFTATVTPVSPASGNITGTVSFLDGTTTLGTGTLNAQGKATFAISTLSVGTHTIKAIYA